MMPVIYDKDKKKALDTETGRSFRIHQRNYYQSTFEYWLQDDNQKYEVGAYKHYIPSGSEGRDLPLEKVVTHVQWFLRVNDEGQREDNPQSQQK